MNGSSLAWAALSTDMLQLSPFGVLVSQLSSTLPSSAGGGGKGSPSSPGKKNKKKTFG